MSLKNIALLSTILPLIAVHACYIISAYQGYVDWCIPYITGCSSISAAGRHGVAYFLFKALMIPSAVLMAFYWWLNGRWLEAQGDEFKTISRVIIYLGLIASLGLILYSFMLGSIGEIYRLQRRIGVILYFGFTFIAQLLMMHRMKSIARKNINRPSYRKIYQVQLVLCIGMLFIGLMHLLFSNLYSGVDEIDNIAEWNFAILMISFYFSSCFINQYQK